MKSCLTLVLDQSCGFNDWESKHNHVNWDLKRLTFSYYLRTYVRRCLFPCYTFVPVKWERTFDFQNHHDQTSHEVNRWQEYAKTNFIVYLVQWRAYSTCIAVLLNEISINHDAWCLLQLTLNVIKTINSVIAPLLFIRFSIKVPLTSFNCCSFSWR